MAPRRTGGDDADDLADFRAPGRALDHEARDLAIAEVPDVEHRSDEHRLDGVEAGDGRLRIGRAVGDRPAGGGTQQDAQGDGGEAGNENHDVGLRY